jgi:two-component system, OmpR family, response regulator
MKVLLAEDDPVMREMVEILLGRRSIPFVIAEDGREAVAAWETGGIDLILMDVQMPEMDGFEAARTIREREREKGGHVPIVAMTAWALAEDEERCRRSGMDEYLTKPIDFPRFYALLEKYAGSRE